MKKIAILLLLLVSLPTQAGGDYFNVKILGFSDASGGEYILEFIPLDAPYGMKLDDFKRGNDKMSVSIKFGCPHNFIRCNFVERSFDKQQYFSAINRLKYIAKPNEIISLGVMGAGLEQLPGVKGQFRSNGAFVNDDGVVFIYVNSHL